MPAIYRLASVAVWALLCVCTATAQTASTAAPASAELHISIGARQIKFTPLRNYQELRLEIFNDSGALLYTSGAVTEAELNYDLHDSNGQPLAPGLYAYTLTVKTAETGTPRQHQGHFIIEQGQEQIWLTSKDAASIGAEVTGGALTVARSPERSTVGARSLGAERPASPARATGDRKIAEQSPLTPETGATLLQNVTGSGTTNKLARWSNGSMLGDSIVTQNGAQIDVAGSVNLVEITPGAGLGEYRFKGFPAIKLNSDLHNITAGTGAGSTLTTGAHNTFIGSNAGVFTSSGNNNTFVGSHSGRGNTTGHFNTFIGNYAGQANTTGHQSTFLGTSAGYSNTDGGSNTFIGSLSGDLVTIGSQNTFLGAQTGRAVVNGSNNTLLGSATGFNTTGSGNTFVGSNTGVPNTSGSNNTYIGYLAGGNSNTLTNAAAIGAQAQVTANNSLVLGSVSGVNGATANTNVGIGVTAPTHRLHVNGGSGTAVYGVTNGGGTNFGVYGVTTANGGYGVYGYSDFNGTAAYGVVGQARGNGVAVQGNLVFPEQDGYAGYFNGRTHVNGTFTASVKNFRIDHPLDPANKYLSHASIESAEIKNLYDGVAVLNEKGEAVVELPDWFEALNSDFRYQLTCIGGYAPVYIAAKIANGRFRIAGGQPGLEVSWQVTGKRQDAYAKAHPLRVEEEKPEAERGHYQHPELHGQPEEKSLEWARNPEMMRQLKQRRESAEGEKKPN